MRQLLDAGVNVALGTDGTATSDTADIIEAIRAASLLHKIGTHDTSRWLGAEDAFGLATRGGARSTGLADEIGALEAGRKADVILLDRDAWGFIPLNDPIRQLAFSITSEAVQTSIIDGRVVMRDRVIATLDEAAIKAEVAEAAERFRRERLPAMHAGARRVEPYVRQVYERATAMDVPVAGDARRPPPGFAHRHRGRAKQHGREVMISNPVPWPDGARCAAAITLDMDADSLVHLAHPKDSISRVSAISMLRYGPEVAIPRILETYRRFGLRQTFFVPAWCIEQYPRAIEAMLADGHEVAHHGYIHENPRDGTREEQHYWLKRGIEVIERTTGQRPRGWRAPLYNFSDHSADLLIEEGFVYDASLMGDDIPYVLRTGRGELIELPSHWGLDDWPPYVHSLDLDYVMQVMAPDRAIEGFEAEFEAMWEHGGMWIAVWHPFVSGRLARWRAVERLIGHMLAKGKVWFAPLEDIAAHVRRCIENGSYKPRVDQLPYYAEPVSVARR